MGKSLFDKLVKWSQSPTQVRYEVDVKKTREHLNAGGEKIKHLPWFAMATGGLLSMSLIITGVAFSIQPTNRSEEIKSLMIQIEDARAAATSITENEALGIIDDVIVKGRQVADFQNEWRGWSVTVNDEGRVRDIFNRLKPLVGDNAALAWFSPLIVSDGRAVPLPADKYVWEFSVTHQINSAGDIPVVWMCKDSDGNVLAWTVGTYKAGSQTFGDMHTGVTSFGKKYLISDDTAHVNGVG